MVAKLKLFPRGVSPHGQNLLLLGSSSASILRWDPWHRFQNASSRMKDKANNAHSRQYGSDEKEMSHPIGRAGSIEDYPSS